VRIDSGDIVADSRAVRRVLDRAGLQATDIFISGDLDEYRITSLLERGARVNGFGVGTALSTSSDAPALGGVYKLVEIERDGLMTPVVKHSPGKSSYAGIKQVWRTTEAGRASGDVLAEAAEPGPDAATPLLSCVMKGGRRVEMPPGLADLRTRCLARVQALPDEVRRLEHAATYPVEVSARLRQVTDEALARVRS
jgi:nicotinate phosphoribosyltransferase